MKFSEYVGESGYKKKDIEKKIVETPLGPTEEDFYDTVARRDKPYLVETSVGYGLSKLHLKRTFDYIKSWLIRYNIAYEAINPYLTMASVEGEYKRDKLIKSLKKIREDIAFKPGGVFILREGDMDFIMIDYFFNKDFLKKMNECFSKFSLALQDNTCYVKLFSIEAKSFDLELFDQMVFSLPELPKVKLGNVGLLARRKR